MDRSDDEIGLLLLLLVESVVFSLRTGLALSLLGVRTEGVEVFGEMERIVGWSMVWSTPWQRSEVEELTAW